MTIIRKMSQTCPYVALGYLRQLGVRKRVLELVSQTWAQILHFHFLNQGLISEAQSRIFHSLCTDRKCRVETEVLFTVEQLGFLAG